MDSKNRFLIAIILSVLILLVYQKVFIPPPDANRIITVSQTENKAIENSGPVPHNTPTEQTGSIENEYVQLVLAAETARVKQIRLKKFKNTDDQSPTPILDADLVNKFLTGPFLLENLLTKDNAYPKWQLVENDKHAIKYLQKSLSGIEVTKEIAFHNSNYGILLRLKIKNDSKVPTAINYKLIGPSSLLVKKGIDERFLGVDAKIGQEVKRVDPKKIIKNNEVVFNESPTWLGIRGRYFSLIMEPKQKEQSCFFEKDGRDTVKSGFVLGPMTLNPGEVISREYLLYAGPNDSDEIALTNPEMSDIITYGFWGGISVLLLKMLNFFNGIFHNYGISIIMLVIVINVLLFPFTRKSLKSMREMQAIQPEIEKLRQEYKDKPQKLNKEIMDLYKKHKVNPIGGCLPMLFQFPVFIALYNALIRAVELKGAGFLWIKDLSEPDATFKLPVSLPIIGNAINILPILVIITMIIQQKMSQPSSSQSEQQKLMSIITVSFIGILFYNLPAGFELYWLTSTVTVLIMQKLIIKPSHTIS